MVILPRPSEAGHILAKHLNGLGIVPPRMIRIAQIQLCRDLHREIVAGRGQGTLAIGERLIELTQLEEMMRHIRGDQSQPGLIGQRV